MRVVEYVIRMMEAHGQTLLGLSALFGDEIVIEILDRATEKREADPSRYPAPAAHLPLAHAPIALRPTGSAYGELESAVRAMNLSPFLKFYLWAYPHYRSFVESAIDLDAEIRDVELAMRLADEAVEYARNWVRSLPLEPDFSTKIEKAAEMPWVRFRADVLAQYGRRPLEVV